MKIPRRVQVGDRWYSVEIVEMLEEKRIAGHVDYVDRHIRLASGGFTPGQLNEAFWHEVVHAILDDMDDKHSNNEAFVTAFSRRLARAVLSARTDE